MESGTKRAEEKIHTFFCLNISVVTFTVICK